MRFSSLNHVSVPLLLWFSLLCHAAEASTKYFFYCSLSYETVIDVNVTVLSDGSLSMVKIGVHDPENQGDGSTRLLRSTLPQHTFRRESDHLGLPDHPDTTTFINDEKEDAVPALRLTAEVQNSMNSTSGMSTVVQVRECACVQQMEYLTEDYFCLLDRAFCAIPGAYYTHPQAPVCLNLQNDEVFVQSVWPIILIWFALSAVFCICTWSGRNAFDYLISCCFPCWNQAILDAMLFGSQAQQQRQEQLAGAEQESVWHRFVLRRRETFQSRYRGVFGRARWAEEGISPDSRECEIRTRVFKFEEHEHNQEQPLQQQVNQTLVVTSTRNLPSREANDDDDDDDAGSDGEGDHLMSCAICFLVLKDGDRVGAIECKHVFHVECLKGWLSRRNVCPLCLQEGIAKPKGQHQMNRRNLASREQQSPQQPHRRERSTD